MIKYSEEFALNIPTRELLHHVQYLGSVSGAELNKLELTKLPTFRARRVDAPLLEGCVGWIECGVHDAYRVGDHTLFVGKVAAVQAEKDAFDETWLLDRSGGAPAALPRRQPLRDARRRLEARIPQAADIKRDVEAGAAEVERRGGGSGAARARGRDEDRKRRG